MQTAKDVLKRWPKLSVLAADLGESAVTVRQWGNRGSIPSNRWQALIEAAARRGYAGITLDLLASIHAAPAPGIKARTKSDHPRHS